DSRRRSSSAVRNAASVFPEPVGAAMRVWRPWRMAAHPCSCAAVGVPRVSENQRWTIGWKRPRDMQRRIPNKALGKYMYFRQLLTTALVCACAGLTSAGTIVVEVRDPKAAPLLDAVVYAVPEGREMAPAARAAVMDQKNKTCIPHVLPRQVGTSVKFPNSDDIQHQVYSFSPAKTFTLPLYKGTPANPIVFTAPGVVTLGCNIHDTMNGYIVVVETPYFEKAEASGRIELRNLPSGKYVVRVWHPDM